MNQFISLTPMMRLNSIPFFFSNAFTKDSQDTHAFLI